MCVIFCLRLDSCWMNVSARLKCSGGGEGQGWWHLQYRLPLRTTFAFLAPYIKIFSKRFLKDPHHPTSSIFHCYPPSPSSTPPLIKIFDCTSVRFSDTYFRIIKENRQHCISRARERISLKTISLFLHIMTAKLSSNCMLCQNNARVEHFLDTFWDLKVNGVKDDQIFFVYLKTWRNWPTLPTKHHCSRRNSNVRWLSKANDTETDNCVWQAVLASFARPLGSAYPRP